MPQVSRPLIGLLVATVLFLGLWVVALKPSSSGSGAGQGLGRYQSAINAAKASVAAQNRAAAAANATSATAPTGAAAAATTPAATAPAASAPAAATPAAQTPAAATPAHAASKPAARARSAAPAATVHRTTPTQRLNVVDRALKHHNVLALLFYNPAAADDQAVKHELRTIPTRHGRVVKLAIPISEVANYPVVTNQVPIQGSPTLVIIDRSAQAFTLVGFASAFEIAHRVDNALSMR